MDFSPKNTNDLFSLAKMGSFFSKNSQLFFNAEKLDFLKVIPQKRMAKNIVILYELTLSKPRKKFKKRVWGKTMGKKQMKLVNFLSKTGVRDFLPRYFQYFEALKFSLSEEIPGSSIRKLERNGAFWRNNIVKILEMLGKFQKLKISNAILPKHSKNQEKAFILNSSETIAKYSASKGRRFKKIAGCYLKILSNGCFKEKQFSFSHFDFQASNIFYDKKTKSFFVLDFDLAKKFHFAADLANFWVHSYVMLRYHFSKERVKNFLAAGFKNISQDACFDAFLSRAVIDIAQTTAALFKKPCVESEKVFDKLEEIIKTNSLCH